MNCIKDQVLKLTEGYYISVLLLPYQITTDLLAENNINLISYSSVDQKSNMDFAGLKLRHRQGYIPF